MELSNNFVITETDQTTHKCTAMLVDYLFHTQNFAVGQCITSQIFEMTCPKIGKTLWTLIVFPAGQYEFESDDGQLSVYLKMIGCEHENEKLLADVKFFIDSEEKFSKVVQASTFYYKNRRTRWVGTKLASKLEFQTQANYGHFIRDNNLVIGCRMIHPATINDETNEIELKQNQTMTIKDEYGNSLEIDVVPYSSSNYSHVNGTESSLKDNTATLPSTSKFRYMLKFPWNYSVDRIDESG